MPYTLHLVSHTHWDREWYLTFQQFRLRLVDLIDHLLDLLDRDAEFRSFHLDSQTIVLEDYLQIKPHNRRQIEEYIRAGRILIGPWYQLNDEYLTSGEATIRSLLVGTRIARQFGACAKIGYLPDQFGNISQMPQIFRGFGIDNAVFGRGYQLSGDRKMEFIWEAPDGSQVTAALMAFWYNNAQHVPARPDEAVDYLVSLKERMAPISASTHLLLMNGVDHLEAQEDLTDNLAAARAGLPNGDRVLHSTIQEYLDALFQEHAERGVQLEIHQGELREDRGGSCLAGTLSARMYIKQANHHAQINLEKYTEPFCAFAMQLGIPYPRDFLLYAWKLLMQNHPHDSICGCSIDQVHREMMPRFAQVEQIGNEWTARALQKIADRVALPSASIGLVVFNSLNWARADPVCATLVFPLGPAARGNPSRDDALIVNGINLADAQGNPTPFEITGNQVRTRQVLSPVELPLDQWVQEISVEWIAQDVPACGYAVYHVTTCESSPIYEAWLAPEGSGWQAFFQDDGDAGDEYLFHPPAHNRRVETPVLGSKVSEEKTAVRHTAVYDATMEIPLGMIGDLSARSEEQVTLSALTRVTRWAGCPRVEYQTVLDNQAKDHRLRVVFRDPSAAFEPLPYSLAEGQFDVLTRPFQNPFADQGAASFYPQQNWVALVGKGQASTVTVINRGLPEYEVELAEDTPQIGVTLLRSVGYLSRRDDGPEIETPEAQCLEEYAFQYAFVETAGDWKEGEVWKQAHQFNTPMVAVQTDALSTAETRDLPAKFSFIAIEPGSLVVTAIKCAEDHPDQLAVRFFNISDEALAGGRVRAHNAVAAKLVSLNEEFIQELEIAPDGIIHLDPIRPKEIVTLLFQVE